MLCKAKTVKSGGRVRCQNGALHGEEYCLAHSSSDRAKQIRKARRKPRAFDREDLLKEIVKDYRSIESIKGKDLSKLRLRATLSAQILDLLKDLHRIDELVDILKKEGYEV